MTVSLLLIPSPSAAAVAAPGTGTPSLSRSSSFNSLSLSSVHPLDILTLRNVNMKHSGQSGNGPVTKFQPQLNGANEVNGSADKISPAFPYGLASDLESISGPTFCTAQTLVQQVAYTLSDRLFTFSPETFALDAAARSWAFSRKRNCLGIPTVLNSMETRLGAGSALLGYTLSKNGKEDSKLPHSIIASTNTLTHAQASLNQLSLLYSVASPIVAHIAAVDYSVNSSRLVTDYASAISVARETGLGLIASFSAHEIQHMALYATLTAAILPTVHIYDGIRVGRESTRVIDALDQARLHNVYEAISKELKEATKKADNITKISHILKSLNAELGTAYSLFEYEGHEHPDAVLVVFGSAESSLATQVASQLPMSGGRVGVISVRVHYPFSETHFLQVLPKSVKRVVVLGQVVDYLAANDNNTQSPLFSDVFSAIVMSDSWILPPPVYEIKYTREHTWTPTEFSLILNRIAQRNVTEAVSLEELVCEVAASLDIFRGSQHIFWDMDNSVSVSSPSILAKALSADGKSNVSFTCTYDNEPHAGILQSTLRISKKVIEAPYQVQKADVSVVADSRILSSYDITASVKEGGTILIKSNLKDDELQKLPAMFRRELALKGIELYLLNTTTEGQQSEEFESALLQLAFLRLANLATTQSLLDMVETSNPTIIHKASESLAKALRKATVQKAWASEVSEGVEHLRLPNAAKATSFALNEAKFQEEPASLLKSWQMTAKCICFREAYGVKKELRPDLTVKNFVVKVRANRRLTPDYYDRNVFHIEFDTTGTGLNYEIGEALGIHAHNDEQEVADFVKAYGLNPDEIVEVPSREDPDILEARTIFQALLQNVDIFGRPPKKFYEALAEFATRPEEKKALLSLASPEGAIEFKRRAEVDTVTYADILFEFPSAHPDFHDLIKIVSPLKRREYSIASAQVVNPNSVHLLIVQVNWVDSKGRDRFGQATRYLAKLPIGAEITVSVKPSVMKLPKLPTQPLIMAGLGTGLAPFRAFLQYRAWQKTQGINVGDILLYMGSRHQREEYLYGEEWEAYKAAGLITHLGCAFSRDQKEKIYIQNRMRQSMDAIVEAYLKKDGVFYLCGPTWPVPDVSAVLREVIEIDAKLKGVKMDSRKKLEEFKEQERYILEVY